MFKFICTTIVFISNANRIKHFQQCEFNKTACIRIRMFFGVVSPGSGGVCVCVRGGAWEGSSG